METLTLQPIGEIPVFDDGYSLVSRAVANDGSLLFLYVEPDATNAVFERFKSGIGIFPKPRMEKAKRFRLVRVSQGEVRVIELPELNITFPVVDVFPDGSILLVATRAQWRAEGDYDLNAVVCDSGTNQAVHFLLGDGINSLGIDEQSRIWVAYSDEGVFGNFGWNNPGPETVGRSGLACFNRSASLSVTTTQAPS